MIVLAVMTYNGVATEPIEASFDELGGTIGRADGNLMVLPDPERTISRVHAKVVFRNGNYAIEDRGSNPILVNGNIVGHGKEWPLAPGDVVQIGGYELGVRASGAPQASDDPFAELFGSGTPAPAPMPPPVAPPSINSYATAPVSAPRRPPAPPAPPLSAVPSTPARGASAIPSDWNPLEPTSIAAPSPLGNERDPGSLLGTAPPEESIDDLFGLGDKTPKPGASAWPEDDDFLGIFDPNAASGGVGEPVVKAQKEDRQIDHRGTGLDMAFPNAVAAPATVTPPPPRVPPAPPVPAAPRATATAPVTAPGAAPVIPPELRSGVPVRGAAVMSWDDGGGRQATIVAPASAARRNGALATHSGGTRPGIAPRPAATAPVGTANSDELLRALLDGLGAVQAPAITQLTPELMRLMGSLLAESVRGTVELLQARASVKREVRAEVTAIRPRQNNPLKFSPTAALALQHLLGPTVPGFLRAEDAMRDAFQDLRAHELAVMAGMRSALAGLLQRFDPKTLEGRITGKSGIGMLLAGGRRAQLWEAYQQLYSQISAEAEDDFHEVFGRAFLQAYQEQLDRLGMGDGGGR